MSFHKTNEFKEFIKHNNKRVVYTVPYSPDLNPIENVFSSLKHYVRKVSPKNDKYLLNTIKRGIKNQKPTSLQKMYMKSCCAAVTLNKICNNL